MKRILSICALTASLFVSTSAFAGGIGYVCSIGVLPNGGDVFTEYGTLQIRLDNGPGCTGGMVGEFYVLTEKSTQPSIPFTEVEANLIANLAQSALVHGLRVSVTTPDRAPTTIFQFQLLGI
jgi:hypothetical protein